MTDESYVFRQTSLERKKIANGVYSRKRGSRSKKCTLPSDSLTAGQLKKRNGEVMQYNLNKPMSWHTFKSMPEDLQREYIVKCREKYGAKGKDLAEMFGMSKNGFSLAMVKLFDGNSPFKGTTPKVRTTLWDDFLRSDTSASEEAEPAEVNLPTEDAESVESETERVKQPPTSKPRGVARVTSGLIHLEGTPEAVFAKAILAMNPESTYSVVVDFCLLEPDEKEEADNG